MPRVKLSHPKSQELALKVNVPRHSLKFDKYLGSRTRILNKGEPSMNRGTEKKGGRVYEESVFWIRCE